MNSVLKDLLQELLVSENVMETLQSFAPLAKSEESLGSVYLRLGYVSSLESFEKELSKDEVISELSKELESPQVSVADRSLKALSQKVMEIVSRTELLTYQQVAAELLQDYELTGPNRVREEKNLLRRVYDALNVLVAIGMVAKVNKRYYWKGLHVDEGENEKFTYIQNLIYKNKTNRKRLKVMWKRLNTLDRLIKRNKEIEQSSETIQFPLLILGTEESANNSIQIDVNPNKKTTLFKFARKVKLIEDTELLGSLELPPSDETVPDDLKQLIEQTSFRKLFN